MILICDMNCEDSPIISAAFAEQGWNKPVSQYEAYWQAAQSAERDVLIATYSGTFAGYTTIMWNSSYPPFREAGIPEIVDFNVLISCRRRGIGTALIDEAERRIAQRSDVAGIGVGLMSDYGNAQILYAHRGYIPDGRGIFSQDRWLKYGDQATVDDDLALFFTKRLTG